MRVNLTLKSMAAGAAMLASGTAAHAETVYCTQINAQRSACYETLNVCNRMANKFRVCFHDKKAQPCYAYSANVYHRSDRRDWYNTQIGGCYFNLWFRTKRASQLPGG